MTSFRRQDQVRLVSPHLKQHQVRTRTSIVLEHKNTQRFTSSRTQLYRARASSVQGRRPSVWKAKAAGVASVAGTAGVAGRVKNLHPVTIIRSQTTSFITTRHGDEIDARASRTTSNLLSGSRQIGKYISRQASHGSSKRLAGAASKQKASFLRRSAHYAAEATRNLIMKIGAFVAMKTGALATIVVAILAVIAAIVSILPSFVFAVDQTTRQHNSLAVPPEYASYVLQAGDVCPEVTPAVIAAQIHTESAWNPKAVSPVGAQGIAQFMPGTWASAGMDGNNDGVKNVLDPADAILTQGHYLCSMVDQVEATMGQRSLRLALAAYNAGLGNVIAFGGVPPFTETQMYVERIENLAATTYATVGLAGTAGGPMIDDYPWADLVRDSSGYTTGLYNTVNWNTRFYYGNCTDFVFWRINRDMGVTWSGPGTKWVYTHATITPLGGNGKEWGKPGNMPGWTTVSSPHDASAGDIVSLQPHAKGNRSQFGHVAYIAVVNPDGSFTTENYGTGQYYLQTFSASEAQRLINTGKIVIKHNPALGAHNG